MRHRLAGPQILKSGLSFGGFTGLARWFSRLLQTRLILPYLRVDFVHRFTQFSLDMIGNVIADIWKRNGRKVILIRLERFSCKSMAKQRETQ